MQNYKSGITEIPKYLDGKAYVYEIIQNNNDIKPIDRLKSIEKYVSYNELSITDKLRFEAESRQIYDLFKIRIRQNKKLNPMNVLKIKDNYYSIYNIYHFTNNDGFPESDITLTKYKKEIILIEEEDDSNE